LTPNTNLWIGYAWINELPASGNPGQFFKADRPLYEQSSVSLVAWNESFIDLNVTDFGQQGTFSQNRAFIGVGKKFGGSRSTKLEVGYLNQFLRARGGDDRFNHILSVNWFLSF